MPVEMLPDRAGREVDFEPLLDELLAIFCPNWQLRPIMEDEHQYHRNEVKRYQLGEAAAKDPAATRQHAGLLTLAAVHDQCRSGIRQLVLPLVAACGHRQVQRAIIDHMRTGSDSEKVGAGMAWYFARPGLQYASMEDLRRGVPTEESKAALKALADLRDDYRSACLSAFLACEDPQTRQDLSKDPARRRLGPGEDRGSSLEEWIRTGLHRQRAVRAEGEHGAARAPRRRPDRPAVLEVAAALWFEGHDLAPDDGEEPNRRRWAASR
ncbi:hypothetical protein ACWGF3_00600 [Streptomyces xanthophaeus]|uniref:hypothetical protein n=1 Tax=Streptomyces xanthophaeus TaxID=67385 RepID=UPI00131B1690|nr:hypothetical protein [Streptomyces xanthophaeus]